MVKSLDRIEQGPRRHAHHAAGAACCRQRARNVCTVPVVIQRQHAAVEQIDAGGERMLQIGVPVIDPCVNDTDFHMDAGGFGPGLGGMNRLHAPWHHRGTCFFTRQGVNLDSEVFFYA
ncbi:hypothetical protein D3C80_1466410 [compost metagenome]